MKTFEKVLLGVAGIVGLSYLLKSQSGTPGTYIQVQPATMSVGPRTDSDRLMDMARRELNANDSELTVRGLIPADLGLTTFTFNLAQGWNTIVNTSSANGRFIMFTGLSYASAAPVASEVKLNLGASSAEDWAISHVANLENHQFVDISPSIVTPNQLMRIEVYATGAGASESISFSGIVVERRGMTVA